MPPIFGLLQSNTAAGSRVYPLTLPQSPVYPAVTYQQISSTATHAMGGDDPLRIVRVQVNSWAETYADAQALAAEVAATMSRYRGTLADVRVLDILLDNEIPLYDSDANVRRVIQDYTLFLTTI
jgi:hypothetical protein